MNAQDLNVILQDNFADDCFDIDLLNDLFENERFIEESEGDFVQNGKLQTATDVIYDTKDSKYYAIESVRTGSYHTDWSYYTPTACECKKVVEMKPIVTYPLIH